MLLKQDQALNQDSYYEAGVRRPAALPALEGRIDADVCVVGAGLTGLSAALELASRGYSVAVLEARKVGWGASGRNGGQVIVGFGHGGEDTIEAQFSAADARRAWDISMQGLELMQQRIARHAIDCDYVPGYLNLAVNARKARALQARVEHMARVYDHRQQWIPRAELGGWIASPRYHAAAFDPFSGHLHPLKYTLGLAAAARTAGVRLFEDAPVIGLDRGDSPTVRTARGAVKCRFVVLAANAYLGEYDKGIAPRLARRFLPVVTYTVATEPMAPERADALIRHRAAAGDTNHLLDYFRVSADHRLLFGGGDSQSAARPSQFIGPMRRRLLAVFPQLADLSIPHAWGGFVDVSLNQAPDFGRLGSNVYYAQGFSGHGLALSGMAGKLIAEAVAGQAERLDLMARLRHRAFPAGTWLRRPALALAMTYFRLLDLL